MQLNLENDITRVVYYLELAQQMRKTAEVETDEPRRNHLQALAGQYEGLALKLAGEYPKQFDSR